VTSIEMWRLRMGCKCGFDGRQFYKMDRWEHGARTLRESCISQSGAREGREGGDEKKKRGDGELNRGKPWGRKSRSDIVPDFCGRALWLEGFSLYNGRKESF